MNLILGHCLLTWFFDSVAETCQWINYKGGERLTLLLFFGFFFWYKRVLSGLDQGEKFTELS